MLLTFLGAVGTVGKYEARTPKLITDTTLNKCTPPPRKKKKRIVKRGKGKNMITINMIFTVDSKNHFLVA